MTGSGNASRPARYDAIADFYVDTITRESEEGPGHVVNTLLELLGDVRQKRVLDLACGHGRLARELARRGARVVGVDLSAELLDKARNIESARPLGLAYVRGDAASSETLAGEVFDLVACHHGLADIDDLDGALSTVRRLLRTGGRFAFSILHPCFPGSGADAPSSWPPDASYYREGFWLATNPGFRGRVGSNHRTLSTYVNSLEHHGLTIDACAEPAAARAGDQQPLPVPLFLVLRCRRSA